MDSRSALLLLAFNALLLAAALGVLSSRFRRHAAGLSWFVVACLASSVNFALTVLRSTELSWLTVCGANIVYLVSLQAFGRGIDELAGRTRRWTTELALVVAGPGAVLVAYALVGSGWARTTVLSLCSSFWFLRCAAALTFKPTLRPLLAARVMAAPFWFSGALSVVYYGYRVVTSTWPTTLIDNSSGGLAFGLVSSLTLVTLGVGPLFVWQERYELHLDELVRTDALTGVRNRRAFFDAGELIFAQHRRAGRPLSVLAIDLDHFKKINDAHGHAVGDDALRHFVARALETVRTSDLFARTGGEEFMLLLTDTGASGAAVVGERLLAALRAHPLSTSTSTLTVTCSVGVAECDASTPTLDALIATADRGLYAAKSAGRACVRAALAPTAP